MNLSNEEIIERAITVGEESQADFNKLEKIFAEYRKEAVQTITLLLDHAPSVPDNIRDQIIKRFQYEDL